MGGRTTEWRDGHYLRLRGDGVVRELPCRALRFEPDIARGPDLFGATGEAIRTVQAAMVILQDIVAYCSGVKTRRERRTASFEGLMTTSGAS